MKKWKDNRGSAMVMVIIVIAFVSILIATLFMLSTVNIQMKSVDRKSKENFYSAEGALDEINLGLQGEISGVTTDAYAAVMQQYSATALEAERRKAFNKKFLQDLTSRIHNTEKIQEYSLDHLKTYLSDEVANHTVLTSTKDCKLEQDDDSLVLRGLVVTYTDDENYVSVIETDIRLTAPNLNLIQPSDMPDIFEYSIIANQGILAKDGGTVNLGANIYAGNGGTVNGVALTGLNLSAGANWVFNNASRTVVDGNILIPQSASLKVNTDMDLWAKELQIEGGALQTKGRTYVSNDLITSKNGSNVTLEGEYYGYGNGEKLTDSGLTLSEGGDASAILVNGTNTSLDLSKVRKLLLSGSAEISTGKEEFDKDEIEKIRPLNPASYHDQLETATLSSGAYTFRSVANRNYVCSEEDYLRARTEKNNEAEGAWERFYLVNNADGTISLKDVNLKKYVSVQEEEHSYLKASADKIGINEKFKLWRMKNSANSYVLQSCANNKYITVEDYTKENGDKAESVLCADRDKVTDNYQLFIVKRIGDSPKKEVPKTPVVTFTYAGSSSATTICFADPSWKNNTAETKNCSATITFNDPSAYGGQRTVQMNMSTNKRTASCTIYTNSGSDQVTFTIRYKNEDGTEHVKEGSYAQKRGVGNNGTAEGGFANGVYSWTNNNLYCKTDNYGNSSMKFGAGANLDVDSSWEKYVLVNNYDGTVSFKTLVNNKYVSVQENGTLQPTAKSIGENEKFIIQSVYTEAERGLYSLKTSEKGNGKGLYVYCSTENGNELRIRKVTNTDERGYFFFQWLEFTDETGLEESDELPETVNYNPVAGMIYKDENSAEASFTVSFEDGLGYDSVNMTYEVYRDKTKSIVASDTVPMVRDSEDSAVASYIVTDRDNSIYKKYLKHKDVVKYRFTYKWTRNGTTYTKTTPTYTYVHETIYGDSITLKGENENVNLGESLEVKSNQIAYLVPPECIGVNKGFSMVGKNPITAQEYTQLVSYANDSERYPDFEMVSFSKTIEDLGHSLGEYRTEGTDGYKTVFVQTSAQDGAETMVYFFVDFDSDNSSKYFRDYYEKHQSELEQYMNQYVSDIKLSSAFTRLTLDGNLLYSVSDESSEIQVKSNEGYGYQQTQAEKDAQKNEEAGYQRRYKALSSKLILDYASLTQQEKVRDIFENLIQYSTDGGATAFAGIGNNPKKYELEIDGSKIIALVVDNKNTTPYVYDSDPNQEICLILATGDVVLEQDFAGTVIAGGTVTVQDNKVHAIKNQKDKLYKILQTKVNPSAEDSETLIQHYFRDGDKYILSDNVSGDEITGDYISYSDLVTYEDWIKR